jgi:hypothetical protein
MNTKNAEFQFSCDTFSEVLSALKQEKYRFVSFGDVLDSPILPLGRTCLLRHDVDVSMDFALDMARIEHEHGVQSTYFVMLRSPVYNLMSRHASGVLTQLVSLGHEIGLHFDAGSAPCPGKSLEEEVIFELGILSNLAGSKVRAFSFHQPSDEALRMRLALPGVINTYNPDQLAGYKYISDSNRVWREADPFQLAATGLQHMHILLHPIWWMCQDGDVKDCWDKAIQRNFESAQDQLLSTERAYGPARRMMLDRQIYK